MDMNIIFVETDLYMYVCMYKHMYNYTCKRMYKRIYVCMYICIRNIDASIKRVAICPIITYAKYIGSVYKCIFSFNRELQR